MRYLNFSLFILGIRTLSSQPAKEPYKIYWDEKLIQGRQEYLKQTSISNSTQKPNIIIILADDLGQTDISLYGNKKIQTPHIDAIGKNGITFEEAYITSPVCSPSRAGLLTGRYQQRFGHELQMVYQYPKHYWQYVLFKALPKFKPMTPLWSKDFPSDEERMRQGLPPSEITLAEVLKVNGYSTGIIGKWHLGAQDFALPCNRGFDYQYGFSEAFTLYMEANSPKVVNAKIKSQYSDTFQWKQGRTGNCAITRNCCQPTDDTDYLTDRLTTESIQFIERNKANPFFLYLAYNAPHAPLQAQQEYYESISQVKDHVQRTYLAMIKNLDDQVGRLMHSLDSLGLSNNTLIFFLSDNGGASYNGSTDNFPLRGGKLTHFEGGIRVPMMMQWKSKIPAGVSYKHPVISLDIFSSIVEATQANLPQDRPYDGKSLLNCRNDSQPIHEALFWRSDGSRAIRMGDWKLFMNEIDKTHSLYNIAEDPSEQFNLFQQHPEVVSKLTDAFNVWQEPMVKPLWPGMVHYIHRDKEGRRRFAF